MKKKLFFTLALALALCMIASSAFAAASNLEKLNYWSTPSGDETLMVPESFGNGFKNVIFYWTEEYDATQTKYELISLYATTPEYPALSTLYIMRDENWNIIRKNGRIVVGAHGYDHYDPQTNDRTEEVGYIKDSGDCTTENPIILNPINMDIFHTNIQEDNEWNHDGSPRYDESLKSSARGYYGISSWDPNHATKTVSYKDLQKLSNATSGDIDDLIWYTSPKTHSLYYNVTKEATCTTKGSAIPTCRVCGKTLAAIEIEMKHTSWLTDEEAANFQLHDHYIGYQSRTHTDDQGNPVVYTYTKAATCTTDGEYTGPCRYCGKNVTFTFSYKLIKAAYADDPELEDTLHPWGAWLGDPAATCSVPGKRYHICSNCGIKRYDSEPVEPTDHKWVFTYETKPTCVTPGTATSAKCSICGTTVSAQSYYNSGNYGDGDIAPVPVNGVGRTSRYYNTYGKDPAPYEVNNFVITEWELTVTADGTAYFLMKEDPDTHPAKYWVDITDRTYTNYYNRNEDGSVDVEYAGYNVNIQKEIVNKAKAATCTEDGVRVEICARCGRIANQSVIKALGHLNKDYYRWTYEGNTEYIIDGTWYDGEYQEFNCRDNDDGTRRAYQKATVCYREYGRDYQKIPESAWKAVATPEHVWGIWQEKNAPVLEGEGKTMGLWYRECSVCHQIENKTGWEAPKNPSTAVDDNDNPVVGPTEPDEPTEDPKTAEPKTEEPKTEEPKTEEPKTEEPKTEEPKTEEPTVEPEKEGWVKDKDGKIRFYDDGEVDTTKTGVVDYEGGKFFASEGVLNTTAMGLNLFDDTWYFLANGQVQDQYTGFAEYNDEWFVIKNGILDASVNGLYDYDGGTFVVAAGRFIKTVNGLWQDPATKGWVFCANGQVQKQFSGVAEYDGYFFVLEDGKLDDKDGYAEYDGKTFVVSKGQLYPIPVEEVPAEASVEEIPAETPSTQAAAPEAETSSETAA